MTQRPQYTQSYTEFVGQPLQQPAHQQASQFLGTAQRQQFGTDRATAQTVSPMGVVSNSSQTAAFDQGVASPNATAREQSGGQMAAPQAGTQQQRSPLSSIQQPTTRQSEVTRPTAEWATSLQQASQQSEGQQSSNQQIPNQSVSDQQIPNQQIPNRSVSGQQVTNDQQVAQQQVGQHAGQAGSMTAGATTARQLPMQGMVQSPSVRLGTGTSQAASLGTPAQARAGGQAGFSGQTPVQQTGIPPMDLIDAETDLFVIVDVPGFDEDDIEIKLEGNSMQVVASERVRDLSENESMLSQERPTAVRRQIQLPTPVVVDDASATYEDGVLTVELPKDQEETAVGKQIGIQ